MTIDFTKKQFEKLRMIDLVKKESPLSDLSPKKISESYEEN